MDSKIKKVAKSGYVSKGVVYFLTGVLAFGAASGLGGSSEGKLGVLEFLQKQAFGNVLLGIMGLGLLCYSFWRFYESIIDPEDIGSDAKGIGKRVGFFISALVYLGLGVFSIYQIVKPSGGGGNSKAKMIPLEVLPYVFYAVAAGLALKAVFQIVKAYKGDFLGKFQLESLSNINTRKTIKWLGYAGLVSRGIVVAIISYFFFRAADTASTQDIKGTSEAFAFMRESYGPWLVATVAMGLICFGLYMFIMAKYRKFQD
ncbi:DUF1206 domain-containing protein [Subsaximicrobium wynnwilliamsii]|uniref:DUF1206 domain-containing protein n=1 Tax=Subsaximicrobium wynnwilliamsii TaxID=291179 RepID=A0A5C6ZEZ1_9FLAO|nr:DUF1206 domain-containing protein [Subsaximicrobium wynnwilliamsii]TXD82109.1 DUF1206 domain-containing protein [Subsaximicrobium wynnwilliamsii]TXD87754.1 DUF1206 domain-containing protein [Subsaximicrobium wynnwilliamsii]TXE01565.1 DUF1206 domain-containing protein [Subsaximicrobium wynnwilliamsii]